MSIYTKLTWPIVDTAAVCALQNVAAPGPLLLTGTLANPSVPNQISFIGANFIRSVSLSSTNNLSGRTFVVNGFQNNAPISESITGPNNSTVYGSIAFDIITSITVNGVGTVSDIQVGTGDSGFLPLFVVNSSTTTINYSVSVIFPPSGAGITYSLFQTLDQINSNFITFENQISNLFPAFGLTNQTTSQIATSLNVSNFILLKVNSSTLPLTDTFDYIFLQA
jgi:hypothetical protein